MSWWGMRSEIQNAAVITRSEIPNAAVIKRSRLKFTKSIRDKENYTGVRLR